MKIDVFRNIFNSRKVNFESFANEKKFQVPKKNLLSMPLVQVFD